MKILLTGVTGYIGHRLFIKLLNTHNQLVCCVRDKAKFDKYQYSKNVDIIEVDFLKPETLKNIPDDIDIAYYLIHSMSDGDKNFEIMEQKCANNFKSRLIQTNAKQVIYLSGIVNEHVLSKHLMSRKNVEDILSKSKFALTTLRAGIIIGKGSASYQIITDLVNKLPIMVAPKWLKTKCQPIAIKDVIQFLVGVCGNEYTYNKSFDIGGPDILNYKDMLLTFAKVKNMKRYIFIVPVMTPKISSYWLYFITSASYSLAKKLVDSMKIEVVCKPNDLAQRLDVQTLSYIEALEQA